jgi:hypothetical protein
VLPAIETQFFLVTHFTPISMDASVVGVSLQKSSAGAHGLAKQAAHEVRGFGSHRKIRKRCHC